MSAVPLAGAILAGGAARRLGGRHKGLLEVDGRAIVERQIAALGRVADPLLIVTNEAASIATGPYAGLGVTVIADDLPGYGPLGGIYTALRHAPHERVLVVACDLPFLSVPLLAHLARHDADVVIPRSPRGLEPLCAIYRRTIAPAIRDRLLRGDLAASNMPEGWKVEEIGPETAAACDPHGLMFVNVNTPHDYERACELAEASSKNAQDRIMDAR